MIKNLVQSILHVVGSKNLLRPNELEMNGTKTIAELLHEEKEKQKEESDTAKQQPKRS